MVKIKAKKIGGGARGSSEGQNSAVQQETTTSEPADSAFSGLREQIEARLAKSSKQPPTKKALKVNSTKPPITPEAKSHSGNEEQAVAKGKKRDRRGTVLTKDVKSSIDENVPEDDQNGVHDERTLEEEIRDLGGTADDLELLVGAESESELEGDATPAIRKVKGKKGEGLDKGIQNIMEEIALAQSKSGAIEDEAGDPTGSTTEEDAEPSTNALPRCSAGVLLHSQVQRRNGDWPRT